MNRQEQIKSLEQTSMWDIVIIGGGASGLGAALDAASRGFKTLCIERFDFSKGTSSRSTKLIHGGVRYLDQGNIKMVKGALVERWVLLKNAPEMTHTIPFILPVYSWFRYFYYGLGLKVYDLLSGRLSIGKTQFLLKKTVVNSIPSINTKGLKGGILYFDGQFDDSEICLSLVRTAIKYQATVINYMEAKDFMYRNGKITGLTVKDNLEDIEFKVYAKVVINATGVFTDEVIRKDNPNHRNIVSPSQGIHLVVDKKHFDSKHALLIPKTTDGRVLFAVPWHEKVVIGTTDTKVKHPAIEPEASEEEIDFVINNFNQYSSDQITKADILSVFAGLRPLVKVQNIHSTADLLRDHTIVKSKSGLITIAGGKWTTYRKMAKDVIRKAIYVGKLDRKRCKTKHLKLIGKYISDEKIPDELKLHPQYNFTKRDVVSAIRHEMAFRIEDVLARRFRLLFLDVAAALSCAEEVAEIMREELGKDEAWKISEIESFKLLTRKYLPNQKNQDL